MIYMNTTIKTLRQQLEDHSNIEFREGSQRYFRETIRCYGVRTMKVTEISKDIFKTLKEKPKSEIFILCEELWKSGILEESFIACNWSYRMHKQYEPDDFRTFEKWIDKYVYNWASCDSFCNHSVGEFIVKFPEHVEELKKWATSNNRWMRRASAVSLIIPARRGKFLKDILEIADILLVDKDDLVQKGYGWMLKASSQAHQQEIFEYVMSKKTIMPRTALRYAIEKMPVKLKDEAMEK